MSDEKSYIRVAKNGSTVQGHNPTLRGLLAIRGQIVYKKVGTWQEITEPAVALVGQALELTCGLPMRVISVNALYSQQTCYAGILREEGYDIVIHFDKSGTMLNSYHGRFGKVIFQTGRTITRLALIDEDGKEVNV